MVDVRSIMKALKTPVSFLYRFLILSYWFYLKLPRHIYDFALDWAMKMSNSQFWKTQRKTSTRNETSKDAAVGAARRAARGSIRITMKSEEWVLISTLILYLSKRHFRDEIQLGKLEQLGMIASEEAKLIALRDYIAKSADAVNRQGSWKSSLS